MANEKAHSGNITHDHVWNQCDHAQEGRSGEGDPLENLLEILSRTPSGPDAGDEASVLFHVPGNLDRIVVKACPEIRKEHDHPDEAENIQKAIVGESRIEELQEPEKPAIPRVGDRTEKECRDHEQ